MSNLGGWNVDSDGFLVSDKPTVKAPPPIVQVPQFFKGCSSLEEAAVKALNELNKPYSYELDGHDVAYQRLSNALVVLLAQIAKVEP